VFYEQGEPGEQLYLVVSGKVKSRCVDTRKTTSSRRTVPLPEFTLKLLAERRSRTFWGEQPMIFPSSSATWRDPDNFNKQWRKVRDDLGVRDYAIARRGDAALPRFWPDPWQEVVRN
jgi:hypothetical protein